MNKRPGNGEAEFYFGVIRGEVRRFSSELAAIEAAKAKANSDCEAVDVFRRAASGRGNLIAKVQPDE